MDETETDGYPWEVTPLRVETWAMVKCQGCRWVSRGEPGLEGLAYSHVRRFGHTVIYETGMTRGWRGHPAAVTQES